MKKYDLFNRYLWIISLGKIWLNNSTVYQSRMILFDKHEIGSFASSPRNEPAAWISLQVFCPEIASWNTKNNKNGFSTIRNPCRQRWKPLGTDILFSHSGLWILPTQKKDWKCRGHLQATQRFGDSHSFLPTRTEQIFVQLPLWGFPLVLLKIGWTLILPREVVIIHLLALVLKNTSHFRTWWKYILST